MKKSVVFLAISVLICGVTFTGCTSDREEPNDSIQKDGLYVTGAASVSASSLKAATETVFTGDDIVSFNLSDGEIVFAADRMEAIMAGVKQHSELYFYIDGKPVFDPAIRIHYGYGATFDDFDLQFRTDGPPIYEMDRVFLTDVYMNIDTLPEAERLIKQQEMEANKAKRKKELDALIKYLSAAGKIIDVKTDGPAGEEPEPEVTGIRIKDNPCETLRYIRKIGCPDFDSALDSIRMFKNITSEIAKIPLEVIFDADDRQFYGIEFGGAGKYTDVLDTKGHWYERTYECAEEDKQNVGDASSISGSWKVKALRMSESLADVGLPPENAGYKDILIMIPETDKDYITGNTYFNTIEIRFKISEGRQISFKDYGGSRIAEDDFGATFREHIMLNVVKFDISNNELKFIDSQDFPVITLIKNN